MIRMESVIRKAARYFITGILMTVFLWTFASCSRNTEVIDEVSDGDITLSIGFKLAARTVGNEYEEGETYENYIDVANENYRIYFFDTDNKFIARFEPSGFIITDGSDYRQYSVLGKAPDALVHYATFRLVVLANWAQYDDANMNAGKTTIEEICNAEWAQFDCLTNFDLNPKEGRLIPFYGIHEYSGVTFNAGQTAILKEPVTLLRAMAKVEVLLETDDYFDLSFSNLKINRYNTKGFCAPENVFMQSDSAHNGNWAENYVHTLHLVNGINDEEAKELAFRFVKRWNDGQTIYEKWVAYLAEYKNVGVNDNYSSIKAKFNIQLTDDTPHTIYFSEYSDGKTDNSDSNRLDIERNNIYRFRVRCTGYNFKLLLSVSDWAGLYENNFEFGDGQIVSPVSPWEDEISNDVEF